MHKMTVSSGKCPLIIHLHRHYRLHKEDEVSNLSFLGSSNTLLALATLFALVHMLQQSLPAQLACFRDRSSALLNLHISDFHHRSVTSRRSADADDTQLFLCHILPFSLYLSPSLISPHHSPSSRRWTRNLAIADRTRSASSKHTNIIPSGNIYCFYPCAMQASLAARDTMFSTCTIPSSVRPSVCPFLLSLPT